MAEPQLSVVIPTRDRQSQLAATLRALEAEAAATPCEVVVVDDGSGGGTGELLEHHRSERYELRYARLAARGPAAARNHGVGMARAERILFLGDDTRPAPGCLAAHLDVAGGDAAGGEVAVQGRIEWDPEAPVSEVMDFLAPRGQQFYFAGLVDRGPVPWTGVLGSNLSAPRRWLLAEPFDEGFPAAALEDTELALRWRRRGWSTRFAAEAVAWHHHHYATIEPFLARQRRAGRAARHLVRRHPRALWRVLLQPLLMAPLTAPRIYLRTRDRRRAQWDLRCRLALWEGFLAPG